MSVARILIASGQDPSIALEEAYAAAQAAESAGESSGRAAASSVGWPSSRATWPAAVRPRCALLCPLSRTIRSPTSRATCCTRSRLRACARSSRRRRPARASSRPGWPDVRDAYEALLAHPAATERQAVELIQFLGR
jgi:hypothetical protein